MSNFTRKDKELLNEAYSVQLLKESFPKMTLGQLEKRIPLLNESESAYVDKFSEKVIEELFGGLKALAGAGGKALGGAGAGLKSGLQSGLGAAKDAAKGAFQGAKAAAGQVGQNVKDLYQTGQDVEGADKAVKQANAAAMQLVQLVKAAQQKGFVTFSGDPMTMSLEDIVNELVLAQQGAGNMARSAGKRGIMGGAAKAFQSGFRP